ERGRPRAGAVHRHHRRISDLRPGGLARADRRADGRVRRHRLHDRPAPRGGRARDRKSTRLNSSHVSISYAVFCLKKKKIKEKLIPQKTRMSGVTEIEKSRLSRDRHANTLLAN